MNKLLLYSMKNKKTIVIFYMDRNQSVTQRYIRVIRMNKDSIIAYCFWRRQVRMFKITNILSAGKVGKKGA